VSECFVTLKNIKNLKMRLYLLLWIIFYGAGENLESNCDKVFHRQKLSNCRVIPQTKNHCQLCTYNGIKHSICDCSQQSLTNILDLVPNNTVRLILVFSVSHGFYPFTIYPVDITGIARLKKLQYFHLVDEYYRYFQLYPLRFDVEILPALQNITTITSFKIQIPLKDVGFDNITLSIIVKHIPYLTTLDFSYTRGASSTTISDLLSVITTRNIEHLCLRQIKLLDREGYTGLTPNLFDNIELPSLIELDLSENMITNFPSGIARIAPNLKILDLSGNLLVHVSNLASLFEVLQHPVINYVNFN
jgi:Leucine-rich repeat (LRR) protein